MLFSISFKKEFFHVRMGIHTNFYYVFVSLIASLNFELLSALKGFFFFLRKDS